METELLSKLEVKSALHTGDIEVTYTRGLENVGAVTTERVGIDASTFASEKFDANFSGNRLSITLGPLVKSNSRPHVRAKYRFKNYRGVTDLRKTGGEYKVRRGESITVNTNEYVALGSSFGALSLPRLSLATEGLVLGTSYIDPLWRGVLVLQLVNTNSRTITLKIGEKIAATHFYKVETTGLTQSDADAFVEKSHHYGLTWARILSEDRNPFPQRKQPQSRFDSDLWDFLRPVAGRLAALGITGVVLAGFVFAAGQIAARYGDLPARVTTLESEIPKTSGTPAQSSTPSTSPTSSASRP